MMGRKELHFAPLIQVSLEELVPQGHFFFEKIVELCQPAGLVWGGRMLHATSGLSRWWRKIAA